MKATLTHSCNAAEVRDAPRALAHMRAHNPHPRACAHPIQHGSRTKTVGRFGEQQMHALADYIRVALLLKYNQRNVG